MSPSQSKAIKSKTLDTAFSSFDSFNKYKIKSNLSNNEMKALLRLLKQKYLDIQNTYKGNTVVSNMKNSYANSMNEMILVENKFENINIEEGKELKGALSGLRPFLAIKSPLKMMKNNFYFTSKLLSFSRYLNFYLDFLVM